MRISSRLAFVAVACWVVSAGVFCVQPSASAAYLVEPSMTVAPGSSATGGLSSISDVSNGSSLVSFRITAVVTSPTDDTISVNFPSGFEYVSSTSAWACDYTLQNATDNNYRYSLAYAGSDFACVSRTDFTYRITSGTAVGTVSVSMLDENSSPIGNTVSIGVVAGNSIISARTQAVEGTEYIDSYVLEFSASITDPSELDGLTVDGSAITSRSLTSSTGGVITFDDATYTSDDRPQIGGIFGGATLVNASVNEIDGAPPFVEGVDDSETSTGAVTITFNEGTATLNSTAFSSGTDVSADGDYTLVVTDTALNATTIEFSIDADFETQNPVITSVDLIAVDRESVSMQASFTEQNFTTASGSVSLSAGTSGSLSNAGSTNFSVQTGATHIGTGTLSGLSAGTQYGYQITVADDYGNTASSTGTFTTVTDPITLSGSFSHTGVVALTGSTLSTTAALSISDLDFSAAGDTDALGDFVTGSLSFSWVDAITVDSWDWDGTLTPPVLIDDESENAATESELGTLIAALDTSQTSGNTTTTTSHEGTILRTIRVWAADGVSLSASGGVFTVSFVVDEGSEGDTLYVYRSADGDAWEANSPDETCTLDSEKLCTITTDSLSFFVAVDIESTTQTTTGQASGGGWSGGGSWGIGRTDRCPDGDFSASRYDWECGKTSDSDTIEMTDDSISMLWIIPRFSSSHDARSFLESRGAAEKFLRAFDTLVDRGVEGIDHIAAFRSVDSVDDAYETLIQSAALIIDRAREYRENPDSELKREATVWYESYLEARRTLAQARTLAEDAVLQETTVIYDPLWQVRLPTDARITMAADVLTRRFAERYQTLLSTGTITLQEYRTATGAYQDFLLFLGLYRLDPSQGAKQSALEAFERALSTARKKPVIIPPKPDFVPDMPESTTQKPQINTESEPTQTLGDVFDLSGDIRFGVRNDHVQALQVILKAYGYFPKNIETTGYFGTITRDALAWFSSQVLDIENPSGLFTETVRETIRNLRYEPERFTP